MHTTYPLHSPDFYAGDPYPVYRELRATSPVCWNDVTNFWALLKYEDIRFVSSNPAMFSSTKGITILDPAMPDPVQEGSLIFTDPPRHRQLRKLINSGFTRRQVALLEPTIREIVRGILDDIEPDSTHESAGPLATCASTRSRAAPQRAAAAARAVARQLLEVLDHNGLHRGADAPLRGAFESAYRMAVINTFGGGANEVQRDIIAMAGLGMPRAPRDLRATEKSGGRTQ